MEVEEAALTGESAPVKKTIDRQAKGLALADRKNMLYMSTLISHGLGKAIVTATGIGTEIGHIAKLLKDTEDDITPLQKKLNIFRCSGLTYIHLIQHGITRFLVRFPCHVWFNLFGELGKFSINQAGPFPGICGYNLNLKL